MESVKKTPPKSNPIETLGEIIQWACSPRGGNNFYGRVLNGCGRMAQEGIGTACVTLTSDGKYMFRWDPEWFCAQPIPLRTIVAIHEATHIVLQHCERCLRIHTQIRDPQIQQMLHPFMNIAADMAVNDIAIRQFLSLTAFKKYKTAIIFPENPPFEFPQGLTFEQYLDLLLLKAKETGFDPFKDKIVLVPSNSSIEGKKLPKWLEDTIGNLLPKHLPWIDDLKDMTDAEIDQIMERASRESKSIIKKALEQSTKNHGTIPGNLQDYLDQMLQEYTVPWEHIFQGILKTAISSKLQESTAWPNISMLNTEEDLEPYPGFQKNFEFHIGVAVDTSGSVSDADFLKFMSEIKGIQQTNSAVSIQLIMFDAAIQREVLLDVDEKIEQHKQRYGYGGTSFIPPLKRFLRLDDENDWEDNAARITQQIPRPDLVVILTDGYAPVGENQGGPIPKYRPACPILWTLTPSGAVDNAMEGHVVRIT